MHEWVDFLTVGHIYSVQHDITALPVHELQNKVLKLASL